MKKMPELNYLKKSLFLFFMGIASFQQSSAKDSLMLFSPDKNVVASVSFSAKGQLSYSVRFNSNLVLPESFLGITVGRSTYGHKSIFSSVAHSAFKEKYKVDGGHAIASNGYNQAVFNLSSNGEKFQLEMRVFNDGVAYRYIVPGAGQRTVTEEKSQWNFPKDATLWYNTDYEEYHKHAQVQEFKVTSVVMPLTVELPQGQGFMAITEGNLVNYAGSKLVSVANNKFQLQSYDKPVINGKIVTPWRLTIITKDLNGLVNSDMVTNVCPPPSAELKKATWIKPGRAVWSWWASETVGPEEQKRYADMGAELGFEYNLIDGGWEKWPNAWKAMADVINYSRKKNIKIWVWKHSKDLTDKNSRMAFFRRVKSLGVVGVKIDFFPPETMPTINYYEDILKDAATVKLMVNFHGTNKPTGRNRTWPHEITREGVCGQEWHILRYNRTEPFTNGTIMPFTRFVVGPGDYTPCALIPKELRGYSWPHEYAEAVIFTSPVQHFADDPKYYVESPGKELLKTMPAVWDETIVLPGSKIGEVAAYARRKGNIWYVAVVNADAARDFSVKLSFLGNGEWNLVGFSDNPDKEDDMIRADKKLSNKDSLEFRLRPGGGFIARLMK
jgi:alpha-glucosidase